MIGKYYLYNGQSINKKDVDYDIVLENVDWRKLIATDREEEISESHGIKVTQTYARSRIIEITGYVLADSREKSAEAINYLDNLFVLGSDFNTSVDSVFSLVDEKNNVWEIKCKVKEPLRFLVDKEDNVNFNQRKFKVILQAPDPIFHSGNESLYTGSEGIYGGQKMPLKMSSKLNLELNKIEVQSFGNIATKPIIELKVKEGKTANSPITIKNQISGEYFIFDSSGNSGDIFVIDSDKKTLTKNAEHIIETRREGSIFPSVKGKTSFSIYDADGGLYNPDFDIKIYFRNALL